MMTGSAAGTAMFSAPRAIMIYKLLILLKK
jgi:hypothetical protein